ncbi:hypothetical protein AB6A40_010873 [Gnathostoma spinigerum]|uniref:Uncharacterized protein n=1 Tax=Gnathostoma spinigerum TaxID=75299 RepID=A0ABD6EW37_9BILA
MCEEDENVEFIHGRYTSSQPPGPFRIWTEDISLARINFHIVDWPQAFHPHSRGSDCCGTSKEQIQVTHRYRAESVCPRGNPHAEDAYKTDLHGLIW